MAELAVSGIVYLAVFAAVMGCLSMAQRRHDCGRHAAGHVFAAVGIVALSLMAEVRAPFVGADTDLYPPDMMAAACNCTELAQVFDDELFEGEPLNALLCFGLSRITGDYRLLLFAYQFLTFCFVYLAIYTMRERVSMPLAGAVYLFALFNNSLNLMRQSVSCAILLLAMAVLLKDKARWRTSLALVLVAGTFHISGFIGAALLGVSYLVSRSGRRFLRWGMYALILAVPLLARPVAEFLIGHGLVDGHIRLYLDMFVLHAGDSVYFLNPFSAYSLAVALIMTSWVVLPRVLKAGVPRPGKGFVRALIAPVSYERAEQSLRTMNIAGYLLFMAVLFGMSTIYGQRFSVFFDFMYILAAPLAAGRHPSRTQALMLLGTFAFGWALWVMRLGWSASQVYATVPLF